MVYCPASVGFVKPEDMFWSKNKITKGVCQSITGDLPAVPAQDFIDEVLGKGERQSSVLPRCSSSTVLHME